MASNKNSNSQCNPLAAVPHYATPNFAAVLPEYVNAEQDIIRQAFQTGNCAFVRSRFVFHTYERHIGVVFCGHLMLLTRRSRCVFLSCAACTVLVSVRYLQSLPDQIKPHSVIETRLDHMEHNRNFSMNGEYKKVWNLYLNIACICDFRPPVCIYLNIACIFDFLLLRVSSFAGVELARPVSVVRLSAVRIRR